MPYTDIGVYYEIPTIQPIVQELADKHKIKLYMVQPFHQAVAKGVYYRYTSHSFTHSYIQVRLRQCWIEQFPNDWGNCAAYMIVYDELLKAAGME